MNLVCRNFPARILPGKDMMTIDGRTFVVEIDRDWNDYSIKKLRLLNVGFPEVRPDSPPEIKEKFEKARKCLTLALIGDQFETDKPTLVQGRHIIVSPLKPNEDGKAAVRAYVQIGRDNVIFRHLVLSYRHLLFMHVNAYMAYLEDLGWDLDKAKEILATLQPMDLTFLP